MANLVHPSLMPYGAPTVSPMASQGMGMGTMGLNASMTGMPMGMMGSQPVQGMYPSTYGGIHSTRLPDPFSFSAPR